jgi:hypothetical protein
MPEKYVNPVFRYGWVTERNRRSWVDRSGDRLSKRSIWAVEALIKMAKDGPSEHARLRALEAIFTNMMSVSKYLGLITRVGELEEKLDEIVRASARED